MNRSPKSGSRLKRSSRLTSVSKSPTTLRSFYPKAKTSERPRISTQAQSHNATITHSLAQLGQVGGPTQLSQADHDVLKKDTEGMLVRAHNQMQMMKFTLEDVL